MKLGTLDLSEEHGGDDRLAMFRAQREVGDEVGLRG
jgi:hypothetical protein